MKQQSTPTIIDIEASGFGSHSYPIEVGIVTGNGEKYCALICPQPDWLHWEDSAEEVHGISREMLFEHGRPPREVAERLNRMLSGTTIYTDGWVVDKPWLIRLYQAARLDMTFRISPLEMILSEEQMRCWHKTRINLFDTCRVRRHRASHDAWIVQQTYIEPRSADRKSSASRPANSSQP